MNLVSISRSVLTQTYELDCKDIMLLLNQALTSNEHYRLLLHLELNIILLILEGQKRDSWGTADSYWNPYVRFPLA